VGTGQLLCHYSLAWSTLLTQASGPGFHRESMFVVSCNKSLTRCHDLNAMLYLRRGADKSLAFPIFLFAAQPKEFFLDGLKNLEQRSHKCMELRGEYVE
jgi:hypothetical protein